MATYKLAGQYNYSGVVEADSETEAWKIFYKNLNSYYDSPEEEQADEICPDCEEYIEDCECEEKEEEDEEN